ncbi:MAG: xanthine dehydrogenase family protein subunit M [Symbiobacteriaceae bacterium]
MITPPFDYVAPRTVTEAVQLLRKHGYEAKVLAGGQSLIPMLRFRLLEPALLVDINRIEDLAYLREEGGFLRIGALTRHADLENVPGLERRYPLLVATARVVADPLVRNRGTVAGSLVHADPAGDWGAAMLAAGAQVVVTGPDGSRTLSIDEFLVDTFTTAMAEDELLTEVRVPIPPERSGGAYLKLERKLGDFAIAAVGVQVTLNAAGECTRAGIGLCAVGPISLRASRAEEYLVGKPLTADTIAEAARLAAEQAEPTSDQRGPEDYKRDMVRVLTQRALQEAAERARAA